jgi:hypothetical protein
VLLRLLNSRQLETRWIWAGFCGAHPPMKGGGNSWLGLRSLGQEAMVKAYGVVMAMPQG